MTKFTVVSSSDGPGDAFLPPAGVTATGAGRTYRFYQIDIGRGYSFTDIDGEILVECHSFETLEAARAWAQRDVELRLHQTRGVQ